MLLTEDLQEGAVIGGVVIRSPFTAIAPQANEPYFSGADSPQLAAQSGEQRDSPMRAQERHRGRGRPKRRIYATPIASTDKDSGGGIAPQKLRVSQSRLETVCRQFAIARLSVFGSASRNELRPDSDVNLLVDFSAVSDERRPDIGAIQHELSAALGGRRVSVATPDILTNPARRDAIVRDLRLLFEA